MGDRYWVGMLCLSSVLLAGCWAEIGPGEPTACEGALCTPEVTYYRDILPILVENCVRCHQAGGIAEFRPLDNFEETIEVHDKMCEYTTDRIMPPWPPASSEVRPERPNACRDYRDQRILSQADIDTLCAWEQTISDFGAAAAEGDNGDFQRRPSDSPDDPCDDPQGELPEPLEPLTFEGPYTPRHPPNDDYRCFLVGEAFDEETFVVASDVTPGVGQLVHHVLVYEVAADLIADVQGWDDADATPTERDPDGDPLDPGYPCFGGPGFNNQGPITGWVPGGQPIRFPVGSAYRIAENSQLVMQIHYNTGNTAPAPDQTSVVLYTQTENPERLALVYALAGKPLDIPAGEAEAVHNFTFPNFTDRTIELAGVLPHMHLLGTSISAAIHHEGGDDECLVDIPDWDFHWQQLYFFCDSNPDDDVAGDIALLGPNDTIEVQCTYDNSEENQPETCDEENVCTHDTPRDVHWGENTIDEMCLVFVAALLPFAPAEEPTVVTPHCPGFDECYATCDGGLVSCSLECAAPDGIECLQCASLGFSDCVRTFCDAQTEALEACVRDCLEGDTPRVCVETNCTVEAAAFQTCAQPHVDAFECDGNFAQCGITSFSNPVSQ